MLEVAVLASVRANRRIVSLIGFAGGVRLTDDAGSTVELDSGLQPVTTPPPRITAGSTGDDIVAEHPTLGSVQLPDAFGDSVVQVHSHPLADRAVVWVTAGQLGQQSWLVSWDGPEGRAARLDADDAGPARFGPDGRWYVTVDDERLRKLSWPEHRELGSLEWDELLSDPAIDLEAAPHRPEPAGDPDTPGEDVVVLDDTLACWPSENGRLHLIDLIAMREREEVYLSGHPVLTVGEIFPRLAGDPTPCSDVERLAGLGNSGLVAVAHRGGMVTISRLGQSAAAPPDQPASDRGSPTRWRPTHH